MVARRRSQPDIERRTGMFGAYRERPIACQLQRQLQLRVKGRQ
jgi:hypothetical protein